MLFAISYATRTIPHVGPARAARGAHPANRSFAPPARAIARSSAKTPRFPPAPPPPPPRTPPAKSCVGTSLICTRVFTTSSGVVSAATAPPAIAPLKKLIPSVSRRVGGGGEAPESAPESAPVPVPVPVPVRDRAAAAVAASRKCSNANQYIALYGTSLASVGRTPVHSLPVAAAAARARSPLLALPPPPPPFPLPAAASPAHTPPDRPPPPPPPPPPSTSSPRYAISRVRTRSNGATHSTASVLLVAPAINGAAPSAPRPHPNSRVVHGEVDPDGGDRDEERGGGAAPERREPLLPGDLTDDV
eukprot:9047-Pelagococcus_subviridis.AAC.4